MRTALTRAFRVLADCLGPSLTSTIASRSAAAATKAVPPSFKGSSRFQNAVRAIFEPLEDRTLMSTYYISPSGNDANKGTSTSSAWKSIAKVNSTHFNAGDSVLFQGGQTFYGQLQFYNDGGSESNRFNISSYGSGKATINSGSSRAIYILNGSGITINNLNVVGSPGATNSQDGIRIENYASGVRSGFTIENCNISGFAEAGIVFGSDTSYEGLNDVTITNNNVYNNVMAGIESYSVNAQSNTNVNISYNQVHDNYGDGKSTVTGSGIMLQGLNNAMVQYNAAYNNGAKGGNGGVGIWCYSSNAVTFQYNASYNNHGLKQDDGDGFDFDADTSNSVMQYNFSANNTGGGFQFNQWWNDNSFTNDIIRYNVSQDNGRANNYSGIDVWGKVLNCQIYNNTVYNNKASSGQDSAIRISNNTITNLFPSNIKIANNIFVTTGTVPIVDFYEAALVGSSKISFTGNVYYSYSGQPEFVWGNTTYTSFSGWQAATGQEKLNGANVGAYANPQLSSPGNEALPATATSMSFAAYNLLSNTPIKSVGVNLTQALGYAVPLTGSSTAKTIPGIDQHLSGSATPATTSSGSTSTTTTTTTTKTTSATPATTSAGKVGASYLSGYDIGNPNKGTNTESGSTYTVYGGGKGVSGTSDSLRFVGTTLTGNGQIVAQVSNLFNAATSSEAGLMVRSSLNANAQQFSLLLNSAKMAYVTSRSTTGGSTASTGYGDSGKQWIKIVRSGNLFSAYMSSDGSTWSLLSSATIAMGATIDIGLAVTSQATNYTEGAIFKNVSVSGS
jgi:hypothetical protein